MIREEVAACPFCKGTETHVGHVDAFTFAGQCRDCNASGPKIEIPDKWTDEDWEGGFKDMTAKEIWAVLEQRALKAWNAWCANGSVV